MKGQILIADPQDQIKALNLELDKFKKLASNYNVTNAGELENLINSLKLTPVVFVLD